MSQHSKLPENFQNYSFEGDLSIDQHIKEEAKELQISMSKDHFDEGTPSGRYMLKDMLNKAKTFYTASWNDVQTYVRSLGGTSLEELDAQASTAENLEENAGSLQSLDSQTNAKKKWVVYDMVKLGFKDDQIRDGVDYLDRVSEELTREEMLKKTIDYLLEQRRSYDHIIDIEADDHQLWPKVLESHPPAPPHFNFQRPQVKKEENDFVDIQQIKSIAVAPSNRIMKRSSEEAREEQQKELASRSDTLSCPICFNYYLKSDIQPLLNCSHAFCQKCYIDYLNEQINANKVLSIPCLNEGCPQIFKEDQIKQLLTKSQNERYNLYKKVALLNQNPDLRWCIRPGCDKYVIGKKGARKVVCECGQKMCFKCGNASHFGKSCEAAIDKVYKKYAKEQNVQICPQCKARTEKSGGCHHITCSRCNYEWCWLCGKQYTQDHYSATNPERCKKIEINADDGRQQEDYVRDTYCARMTREPILIIAFPLFLVIISVMIPQHLYTQYMKRKKGNDYQFELRNGNGMMLLFALLGIALLPISLVYMLVVVVIDGLVDFYLWIYRKVKGRDIARKPHVLQPNVL